MKNPLFWVFSTTANTRCIIHRGGKNTGTLRKRALSDHHWLFDSNQLPTLCSRAVNKFGNALLLTVCWSLLINFPNHSCKLTIISLYFPVDLFFTRQELAAAAHDDPGNSICFKQGPDSCHNCLMGSGEQANKSDFHIKPKSKHIPEAKSPSPRAGTSLYV